MFSRKQEIKKILWSQEDFRKAWGTRKPFFGFRILDWGDMWFGFSPEGLCKGRNRNVEDIKANDLVEHMMRMMRQIHKKLDEKEPEKTVTILIAGDRKTKASAPRSYIQHKRKESRRKGIEKKGKSLDWDGVSPVLRYGCPIPDWQTLNATPKAMSRARNDLVALLLLLKPVLPGYRVIIDVPCNLRPEDFRELFPGDTAKEKGIKFPDEGFKFPCVIEYNRETGENEIGHIPELEHAHAEADHSFQWFINRFIEYDIQRQRNTGNYVLVPRTIEEQKDIRVLVKSKDIDNLCLSSMNEEQMFYEMEIYKKLRETELKNGGNALRKGKNTGEDNLFYEEDVPMRIYVDHSLNNKETRICNITKLSLIVRRRYLQNDIIREMYFKGDEKAMALVDNPMRNLMSALYAGGNDWVEGCDGIKTEKFFQAYMSKLEFIGPMYNPMELNKRLSQPSDEDAESISDGEADIERENDFDYGLELSWEERASIRTLRKFTPDVVSGITFEAYTRLLYYATLCVMFPNDAHEEKRFNDISAKKNKRKRTYNPTVPEVFGRYMRVCYAYITGLYAGFIRVPIFDNYKVFCWKDTQKENGQIVVERCAMDGLDQKYKNHLFWNFSGRKQ